MNEVIMTAWGPTGWLLRWEREGAGAVQWMSRRLAEDPPDGLEEWIPSFSSVLFRFRGRAPTGPALREWIGPAPDPWPTPVVGRTVEIPVRYDGPDLEEVARRAGFSVGETVRRHVGGQYRVRCLGFSPGFAYLEGLDPALRMPRRETPRTQVRVGSVAIGGEHAGVYSVPSPGGWHLLGSTARRMFDPGAARLADRFPLEPGDRVQFVETAESGVEPLDGIRWLSPGVPWLRVLTTGAVLGVQDGGRPGWGRYGVPVGGALDSVAAHWANRLLGNEDGAGVLEFAGGGQSFEALTHVTVSVTGADACGEIRGVDGLVRPVRAWSTQTLLPREVLMFRGSRQGVWTYLGLPGGVSAPRVLGSVSLNRRASLGASPSSGETVSGQAPDSLVGGGTASRWVDTTRLPSCASGPIRVWPGAQSDWFEPAALKSFFRSVWRVSPRSDRVGYRLEGPALAVPSRNLESEPVLPGSIQVPPDGQPIVTMPDGPTMGGYPKIGWVDPRDLARVAQTPAGRPIQWTPVGWD